MSDRTPDTLPEHEPGRWRAPVAALAVAAGGVALWGSVSLAVPEGRALMVVGAVATVAFAVIAAYVAVRRAEEAGRATAELQRARAELGRTRDELLVERERATVARSELDGLSTTLVPRAVARLREEVSADTVLDEIPTPADEAQRRLLDLLVREISVGERRRAAAVAACASAAGRVQAMTTRTLAELRDMQDRCPPDMLGDLMRIDHNTSQTGRLADSIAVLTGARSGRRWTKPIRMESIVRGAMGRISAYRRIRVHSNSRSAVAGYAAEDVMHALAEFMDNGTSFSAPTEEVHVYVEDLNNGAVITVEDAGLGMKPQALARAELAVSPTEPLDLTKLSGTRLGLAVVGCLARKHRMHVFFRPSSRGGVGVVLRLPNHLLTPAQDDPLPAPARNGRSAAAPGEAAPAAQAPPVDLASASAAEPEPTEEPVSVAEPASAAASELIVGSEPVPTSTPTTEPDAAPRPGGARRSLPQRPRGQTLRSAPDPDPAPATRPPESRESRPSLATRFGAFQRSRARGDARTSTGPLPLGSSVPPEDDTDRGA